MYRKVLVPLDGSQEAEAALLHAQNLVAPDGEIILLQVITPDKHEVPAYTVVGPRWLENEIAMARGYLHTAMLRVAVPIRIKCAVVVDDKVDDAIVDYVKREGVDLVTMYTTDKRGFGRLRTGSVARQVRKKVPAAFRLVRPQTPEPRRIKMMETEV